MCREFSRWGRGSFSDISSYSPDGLPRICVAGLSVYGECLKDFRGLCLAVRVAERNLLRDVLKANLALRRRNYSARRDNALFASYVWIFQQDLLTLLWRARVPQ